MPVTPGEHFTLSTVANNHLQGGYRRNNDLLDEEVIATGPLIHADRWSPRQPHARATGASSTCVEYLSHQRVRSEGFQY